MLSNKRLSRSIINNLIISLLSIGVISISGLFFLQYSNTKKISEHKYSDTLKQYYKKIDNDIKMYENFIELIKKDTKTIELFKRKDTDALFEYYEKIFLDFKKKQNISHFYFHTLDKKVLLRVHNRRQHSDIINRVTLDNAKQSLKNSNGIEFGINHNYTLRVVSPWFVDKELIGFIELGKEIDYLTPEFAKDMETEIVFTIKKDLLSKDEYNIWSSKSKSNLIYKDMKNYYIIDSSIHNISNELSKILDKNEKVNNECINNGDNSFYVYNEDFKDITGKVVGKIYILNDVTDDFDELYRLIFLLSIFIFVILVVIFAYHTRLLKSAETKIIDEHSVVERLSITDELTSLYNRRYFNLQLSQHLKNAKNSNHYLCILIIDIDNFKKYNDTYGHLEGDKILALVASEIQNTFKRTSDKCYRIGGEEFAVILEANTTNIPEIFAKKLCKNIEQLNIEHEKNENYGVVTVSIGTSFELGNNIDDVSKLYKNADNALYQAKKEGRNRVILFTE